MNWLQNQPKMLHLRVVKPVYNHLHPSLIQISQRFHGFLMTWLLRNVQIGSWISVLCFVDKKTEFAT